MKHFMQFFAPDGSEGGGSAVLDAPTAPETFDVGTFEPKGVADIEREMYAPEEMTTTPPPKPEPAKKPEAKAPEKPGDKSQKPAPKQPDAKKPGEQPEKPLDPATAPVAHLRKAYEETKAERDRIKTELETLRTEHPELKQARTDLEEVRKRVSEYEQQKSDLEKRLAFHSPESSARFMELDRKFDDEVVPQVEMIPKMNPTDYNKWLNHFKRLPHADRAKNPATFAEAYQELEQMLVDEYGERNTDRLMPLLARGMRHLQDREALKAELQADSGKFMFDSQRKRWDEDHKRFASDMDRALEVDKEVLEHDPYHPTMLLQHFSAVEPDKYNERMGMLKKVAELALMPPKPRQKTDFPDGWTDAQIAESIRESAKQHADAKRVAIRLIVQGGLGQYFTGAFWKQFKQMEERLGAERESAPEIRSGGEAPRGAGDTVDPANYKYPDIDESKWS